MSTIASEVVDLLVVYKIDYLLPSIYYHYDAGYYYYCGSGFVVYLSN